MRSMRCRMGMGRMMCVCGPASRFRDNDVMEDLGNALSSSLSSQPDSMTALSIRERE